MVCCGQSVSQGATGRTGLIPVARRIETQQAMQQARRGLSFCYLCGSALPSKRRGATCGIVGEHVIPRALLGEPLAMQCWPVVLDVHTVCEESIKSQQDSWISALQAMHTLAPENWPAPGHVRGLPVTAELVSIPEFEDPVPAFQGVQNLLRGVASWIRGFHAALYRESLQTDVVIHALPPVPAMGKESGLTLHFVEEFSSMIIRAVHAAVISDRWDGINAWCGELRYFCTWWRRSQPNSDDPERWICYWTLTYPGVLDWSRSVTNFYVRPWHGYYELAERPTDSSVVTQREFDEHNRRMGFA